MSDVEVTFETYADREVLSITTAGGAHVRIAAEDPDTFYTLVREVFGDKSTLAGEAYREILDHETDSGLTVQEIINAGRDAAEGRN